MIAGMIPMAIGAGEGGEQTAPLGRAVIGGLVGATLATLVVLPAIFAILQGERTRKSASIHPDDDQPDGTPPPRVNVTVRGQVTTMRELFGGLTNGLGVAVLVIFLLLAANFQSLRLSLAIILTVPAVVAGVAVALYLTHTTINIQSFMGAIMAVGVAVANSILLITFVERNRVGGMPVARAAAEGAASRLRPILMTSCAMIAGMIPMAIGAGEGGEQTAPLGRAVIGGLIGATLATLIVLPALFAILQSDRTRKSASIHPDDDPPDSSPRRAASVTVIDENGEPAALTAER
jgi:multidrug efflux pump subunit AcrB